MIVPAMSRRGGGNSDWSESNNDDKTVMFESLLSPSRDYPPPLCLCSITFIVAGQRQRSVGKTVAPGRSPELGHVQTPR